MSTTKSTPTNTTKGVIYLRYAMLFLFGTSIGTGGTLYFAPDKSTKEISLNEGLPQTVAIKTTPLNDDLNENEKRSLWRFDMVEVSEMDTLRGKGLPTYI